MAFDRITWALSQDIKSSNKLVLVALANRADRHVFDCHPSILRLEKDTGMNRKTIMKSIQELEGFGLIVVTRINGSGNKYTLKINNMIENTSATSGTGAKLGGGAELGTTPVPNKGLGSPNLGITTSPKLGIHNLTNEPNNNLTKNLTEEKYKKLDLDRLPEGISNQAAKDFIDHRIELKARMTQKAFDLAMNEALKAGCIGITPDEAIHETIMAGWKGIKLDWLKNRIQKSKGDKHGKFEERDYSAGADDFGKPDWAV